MKQPFRYHRGEFNGKLLYDLVTMMNFDMRDIIDELVYQILFQWKTEDEAGRNEMPIRDNDIIGIGKIAGVFQAYGYFSSNTGSLWFTPSHVVNGTERNERGLVNMEREVFEYVQTEKDDYPLDIVTEASVQRRISVVPPGTKPVGYVAEGTKLYETNGNIIWENVLSAPPADKAYVPFFGEKYLVLEEEFIRETALTVPILKLLIECLQKVRHDGPSIALFLKITQILGEGYIYDIEIIQKSISFPERSTRLGGKDATMGRFKIGQVYPSYNHYFYEVQYKRNLNVIVDNQQRRYAVWKMVCDQKFKLFRMVDITKDIGDQ